MTRVSRDIQNVSKPSVKIVTVNLISTVPKYLSNSCLNFQNRFKNVEKIFFTHLLTIKDGSVNRRKKQRNRKHVKLTNRIF